MRQNFTKGFVDLSRPCLASKTVTKLGLDHMEAQLCRCGAFDRFNANLIDGYATLERLEGTLLQIDASLQRPYVRLLHHSVSLQKLQRILLCSDASLRHRSASLRRGKASLRRSKANLRYRNVSLQSVKSALPQGLSNLRKSLHRQLSWRISGPSNPDCDRNYRA